MVRELADVPDEVHAVPPPPLPVFPEPYSVRFADPDADAAMISEWMNRPHLANTWHYDRPPHEWRQHLGVQFEGAFSRPVIFSFDGRAIGYLELFRAARDCISTLYEADPYDMAWHTAFAAEVLQQGHARTLLPHLIGSVFEAEAQCRRFMGDTSPDSDAPGHQACKRLGGLFLGVHDIPAMNRRVALFTWPRSPEDIPKLREAPRQ